MDVLKEFLNYAAAFEITYKDDSWDRLHQFFHDDAAYEIESPNIPCTLVGPSAIFAGMKKSLDGFDRRFDTREIGLEDDLEVDENSMSVSWAVTYTKSDLPPFILKGKSIATLSDNKIRKLVDVFTAESEKELLDWVSETGYKVDPSYV